jgi:hypothetical protein
MISPTISAKKECNFDPGKFLATIGAGRRIVVAAKKHIIYAQGAVCDAVFYIQTGKFRRSGFVDYGESKMHVHSSLLNVVLQN